MLEITKRKYQMIREYVINNKIEFPNFHKSVLNASASLLLALPHDVKMKVFGFPAGGRITSTCAFGRIIKQPFKLILAYFVLFRKSSQ